MELLIIWIMGWPIVTLWSMIYCVYARVSYTEMFWHAFFSFFWPAYPFVIAWATGIHLWLGRQLYHKRINQERNESFGAIVID